MEKDIGIDTKVGEDTVKKGQKRNKGIKGPLICGSDGCGYRTKRLSNMTRHKSTMHQKKDLECCGVSFRNKAKYKIHRLAIHSKGFQCLECNKIFSRKALLKRHSSVHSGIYDFHCAHPNCPYESSHKSNVQRHFISQHPKEFAETGEAAIVRKHTTATKNPKTQEDQGQIPAPAAHVKPEVNEEKPKVTAKTFHENRANVNWDQNSPGPGPGLVYPNYYPRLSPFTIHYHSCSNNYREAPDMVYRTQPYDHFLREPIPLLPPQPSFIDYNNNNEPQGHPVQVPLTPATTTTIPDDPFQNYIPKKWRVVKRQV